MAEIVIENWVKFEINIPKTVMLDDHAIVTRELKDPLTGQIKKTKALQFHVIEEDYKTVDKYLSIVSEKFATIFSPYLAEKTYIGKRFEITKTGRGFATEYSVLIK